MISILLPNLNGSLFLEARIESILNQSISDWEVVVIDGYSSDNSMDIIKKYSSQDPRWRVYQEEPRGIYQAWNSCLAKARGDLIYIATSDDTMDHSLLEKMSATLEMFPKCGLAMCALDFIDSNGNSLSRDKNWSSFPAPIYFGDIFQSRHIRKAPLDGLLSFSLHNIYHSATQLLVRRSTYDYVGLYRTDYGSVADFEWSIRAGLAVDCIFLPEILATWRVHTNQASQSLKGYNTNAMITKLKIINEGYYVIKKKYPVLSAKISFSTLSLAFRFQKFLYEIKEQSSLINKSKLFILKSFRNPKDVIIMISILIFSLGMKERIRNAFTQRNCRIAGISFSSHLLQL
jgi:glycosyltransferase involved in cell wall biosynthesis